MWVTCVCNDLYKDSLHLKGNSIEGEFQFHTAFLLLCCPASSLRSQGILHSFSGTETDRIWPYINSLLITKMHTQPSDAFQTHFSEWRDHRETSRSRQRKWGDVSTRWPQLSVSSLILKFDKGTDPNCSRPTRLCFSHLFCHMNGCVQSFIDCVDFCIITVTCSDPSIKTKDFCVTFTRTLSSNFILFLS